MTFTDLPLPNRALTVTSRPIAAPRGAFFTIVILLALGGFMTWWQGPGLWRDVQINQNPITLRSGDVQNGECTTRRGITDCEARLVYSYNGIDYDTHVEMAFVDFSTGDYSVWVVISGDKPELATLSLGIDMLWNRLIVFAVFALIFFGGVIGMLVYVLRGWRVNSALKTSGRVSVVPVVITARNGQHVSYNDRPKGPKSTRLTHTKFERGQEPLLVLDTNGEPIGLAAKFDNAGLPVLLDSHLERLDLTEAEREHALATLREKQDQLAPQLAAEAASKPKRGFSIWRRLMAFLIIIILAVAAVFAYWVYYVTNTKDRFDSFGMEINNMLPEPLNTWGCEQLYARFGDERAPYGCTGDDYTSWKVAPTASKTKQ